MVEEVSRSFAPHGRHLATGREAQFVPQIRGANLCHKPPRQTCESQVRLRSLCATISVASSERVPSYSPSPISPRRKRGGKRERESNVTACNSEICYRVRQPPVAVRIQILAVTDSYDSQKTRVESYLCPSENESALSRTELPGPRSHSHAAAMDKPEAINTARSSNAAALQNLREKTHPPTCVQPNVDSPTRESCALPLPRARATVLN